MALPQKNLMMGALSILFFGTSLFAQESDPWPAALPEGAIELKQAVPPPLPEKTELPSEFGRELLRNTLTPDAFLNSGTVKIKIEKFLPEPLQKGRVHLINIKLIFDRQMEPVLWAQWTDTIEKNCVFIRGKNETWQVEQFSGEGTKQKILQRNIDYSPESMYCHLFPIFSVTCLPHYLIDHAESHAAFIEHSLKRKIIAVEKAGEDFYLIHQLGKSSSSQGIYSEFRVIWWLTAKEPFHVIKKIGWSRLRETGTWRVTTAWQTKYQDVNGIKVPGTYVSYLNLPSDDGDTDETSVNAELISFDWQEVNQSYFADMFSEKLLEPKATDLVFDARKKADGVIGNPYGAPKIKTMAPREPDSNRWLYWIFAVNLVIFVLIAVFLIVRRAAKNR